VLKRCDLRGAILDGAALDDALLDDARVDAGLVTTAAAKAARWRRLICGDDVLER
jgi:uncharacterized protein YjbI with pentapeptide repeats